MKTDTRYRVVKRTITREQAAQRVLDEIAWRRSEIAALEQQIYDLQTQPLNLESEEFAALCPGDEGYEDAPFECSMSPLGRYYAGEWKWTYPEGNSWCKSGDKKT